MGITHIQSSIPSIVNLTEKQEEQRERKEKKENQNKSTSKYITTSCLCSLFQILA